MRAEASPTTLKAQFADKRVSFDVSTPLPQALFAHLPVQQLNLSADHVTLLTPALETVLRALFALPIEITNLEINGVGLEEAFLRLTHEQPNQH